MCGISGILHFDGKPVARRVLQAMNDLMIHRGPDDEGIFLDGSAGLSMRRLSIIDLSGGHQPMTTTDGRLTLVMNGEIYNYVELRNELIANGVTFRTKSDTEVALEILARQGKEGLKKFNGMFALALWDHRERRLLLARDPLGVKPLFYRINKSSLVFSSELKSLLALEENPQVDPSAFLLYLMLLYVPHPYSLVKGINKLEPAHYLEVEEGGRSKKSRYWSLPDHPSVGTSPRDIFQTLESHLERTMRLQMRSDVPVGVFLSGGLDSSSLVAFIEPNGHRPLATFSVGYEGHTIDERPVAELVARRYQTDHHTLFIRATDVADHLEQIVWFLDEPIADSAFVPTYLLSRLARQKGIKVVLSGTGGDEIFGGYDRYVPRGRRKTIDHLPRPIRSLLAFLSIPWDAALGTRLRDPLLDHAMQVSASPLLVRALMHSGLWQKDVRPALQESLGRAWDFGCLGADATRRSMTLDLWGYLVGDLLMLLDKMTMAASIEGRVPLLDPELVSWMHTLPTALKIKNGQGKVLHRHVLANRLPTEVLHQPKTGFGAPVGVWVREALLSKFKDQDLNSHSWIMVREILGDPILTKTVSRAPHNIAESQLLLSLLVFNSWTERVLRRVPRIRETNSTYVAAV